MRLAAARVGHAQATVSGLAGVLLACVAGSAWAVGGAVQRDLVFDHASPLARRDVVLERVSSPLRAAAMPDAASPATLDLAAERFEMFVPESPPPSAGLGLIVFVPPWEGQGLPAAWLPALERHGFVLVTAERSGNAQDVRERRIPLALTAYENVLRRYRIDPARVHVAGFSGGSRVALRIALAYPDVFRGALLNAGSDPIGSVDVPLPGPELFGRLERGTRLVYVSGARDGPAMAADRASRQSARDLCIANTRLLTAAGGGHEPADAGAFERALQALEAPLADESKQAGCRTRRTRAMAREMEALAALVDAGERDRAMVRLRELDARWGGLVRTASIDLARRLEMLARNVVSDP
jgi:pimeloyl-ACP methyl ester carboxylesterase